MFSPKDNKKEAVVNSDVVETMVGVNTQLTGDVVSQSSIRIDGKLTGNVNTAGNVIIGEKGFLVGNITAKSLVVAGEVKGNVKVVGKIELNKSGKIFGDIETKIVIIEDGAQFTGNCKMEQLGEKQPLLTESNKK